MLILTMVLGFLPQHTNVPRSHPELGTFVNTQRQFKTRGKLDPDRERRLVEIGFSFDCRGDTFEDHFTKLVEYNEVHVVSSWELVC